MNIWSLAGTDEQAHISISSRTGETLEIVYKDNELKSIYSFFKLSLSWNMLKIALFVPLLATAVTAICPGFNYAIGNLQSLGNGINRCAPKRVCCLTPWSFLILSQGTSTTIAATLLMVWPPMKIPAPREFLVAPHLQFFSMNIQTPSLTWGDFFWDPHCLAYISHWSIAITRYACRTDPNSGVCGNDVISVCVSYLR